MNFEQSTLGELPETKGFNMIRKYGSLLLLVALIALSSDAFAAGGVPYMSPVYHTSYYSAMAVTKVELNGFTKSTGFTGYNRYNDYTGLAGPSIELAGNYDIKITRGSYTSVFRHCFIDWNNDGDFYDANETILRETVRNSVTTVSKNFDVPAGTAPGPKRMRIRLSYSYTSSPQWYSSTSYGETEDYVVTVIAPPTPMLDQKALPGIYEGLSYEAGVTAYDGTPPYTYSVDKGANADWVNIDDATGRIFGIPGEGTGGTTAQFDVVVTDSNAFDVTTAFSVNVFNPFPLPYMDDMNGANIGNYVPTLGDNADMTLAAVAGASGLAFVGSANTNANWAVSPGSDANNLAVLNNPGNWDGGASPDPSDWAGSALYVVSSTTTKRLAVEFDYSIVNLATESDKEYFTNFAIEYSEDGGKTWLRADGDNDTPQGFYRDTTTGFAHEVAYLTLSGDQDQVAIRIKWLVRNEYNGPSPTYIAVDNLSTYVPVHFLGSNVLAAAQETVPYSGHIFDTLGGTNPITVEFSQTNPVAPELNLQLVEAEGAWTLTSPAKQGPAVGTLGIHQIEFIARDANGRTFAQTYSLSVAPGPAALSIDTESLPGTTGMTNYSETIAVSGGVEAYAYELVSTSAAWLSLDANTGLLTGLVPEADIGIVHNIEVRVTDRIDTVVSKTLSIAITEHLMVTSLNLAGAEESFTYRESLLVEGGNAPYTWTFLGGQKPIGLSLDPLTGKLAGVPYLGQTGAFEFQVSVKDSGTQEAQATITLDVAPSSVSSLQITTVASAIVDGTVAAEYDMPLNAGGGVPPYAWQDISNGLPAGLSLTSDGRIYGTPVPGTSGRYTLKVRILDSQGESSVQNFTFDIAPQYFAPTIETAADLGTVAEGDALVRLLEVKDGLAPFSWSLISGALPSGMTLNTSGGSIIGTPQAGTGSQAGTVYNFTLGVADNNAGQDELEFQLTITNDPANQFQVETSEAIPAAEAGSGHFSALLTAKNGTPPFTWTVIGGALPSGIQLGVFGGLYGTADAGTVGQYSFTVEARDSIGNTSQQILTMNVVAAGANDPNDEVVVVDGLANLPSAGASGGGCAIDASSNAWLLMVLIALAMFGLSQRAIRKE